MWAGGCPIMGMGYDTASIPPVIVTTVLLSQVRKYRHSQQFRQQYSFCWQSQRAWTKGEKRLVLHRVVEGEWGLDGVVLSQCLGS